MNKFQFDQRLIAVVLILGLMSLACNAIATTRTNDLRTDTQTIDMNSASSASVQIEIAAGKLNVQGGANSRWMRPFVTTWTNGNPGLTTLKVAIKANFL